MVIFFALLVMHRPVNTQIIFTFATPETIETKQRQGNKRKTIGELINTNEPFCVCFKVFCICQFFCVCFDSLISKLHCICTTDPSAMCPESALCQVCWLEIVAYCPGTTVSVFLVSLVTTYSFPVCFSS